MTQFRVDRDKCARDGLCVAACPAKILSMTGEDGFPSPVPQAEEMCIHCGHCVAVCPHGAWSLGDLGPEDCLDVRKEVLPSPEQVEHFFRYRRSMRNYRDKPVPDETIGEVIRLASFAPSAHNLQPVHWLVIKERSQVERYAAMVIDWMRLALVHLPQVAGPYHFDLVVAAWEQGLDRVLRGAPHLIVAHADRNLPTSQSACTIALTYLELAASAHGLGACWAGYFGAATTFYPPLAEALELPADHQSFGAMMLGYPSVAYQRMPPRNPARITWR